MRFTPEQLEAYRERTVPDLIGPGLKLLFVGINPSLWTAATQTHFSHPGNRFYPALLLAGIIEREIEPSSGLSEAERAYVMARGIGITNIVARATPRASELTPTEYREGAKRLRRTVAEHRPRVVVIAGLGAYLRAFGLATAHRGRQPALFEGAELWVVPNPSGLNSHETTASLAEAYREPAVVAGVVS